MLGVSSAVTLGIAWAVNAYAPELPAEARWVDECVAWETRTEVVPRAGSVDLGVPLGSAFKVVNRRHCIATVPVCRPGTREPCPAGDFVHPMTGEPIAP